jgi:hypothetical protein
LDPQQTYNGPDLSTVLRTVHEELGPDAHIISAVRSRHGGLGGFFARQRFTVTAVRRAGAAGRPPSVVDQPGGLLNALLAMADDRSEAESNQAVDYSRYARYAQEASLSDAERRLLRSAPPVNADDEPFKLDGDGRYRFRRRARDEVESNPAAGRPTAEGEPDGPTYDSIFSRAVDLSDPLDITATTMAAIEESGGSQPPGFDVDLRDAGGGGGGSATTTFGPLPWQDRVGAAGPAAAPSRTQAGPSRPKGIRPKRPGDPGSGRRVRSAVDVLPRLDRRGRADTTVAMEPLLAVLIEAGAAELGMNGGAPTRIAAENAGATARPAARAMAPIDPQRTLVGLGVPPSLAVAPQLTVRDIARAFEQVPFAPADVDGATGVVAVVGSLGHVRLLASHLGSDSVVACQTLPRDLAAWLWIGDTSEAESRRRRWMYRDRPMVVAVEGSPLSSMRPFAAEMLRALAPSMIRVIVEASWSIEAMHHWLGDLATLGAPIVLDVVGFDDAAEPASVLHLGFPIATLQGRPASAQWWASLIVERLGEPER